MVYHHFPNGIDYKMDPDCNSYIQSDQGYSHDYTHLKTSSCIKKEPCFTRKKHSRRNDPSFSIYKPTSCSYLPTQTFTKLCPSQGASQDAYLSAKATYTMADGEERETPLQEATPKRRENPRTEGLPSGKRLQLANWKMAQSN
jgi:hypothetical protein